MKLYRLTIVDDCGITHVVTGEEEVIRQGNKEIVEAMKAIDGTGPKIVEIHGMFDSADRAECTLIIRPDKIVSVSLLSMYG